MHRKCRYQPLSAQPLVLVLCQVRFSPVRQMERYIPAIQDAFRRHGFPIERAGKVQQVTFRSSGSALVEVVEQQRWEYRNRDETSSILVMQDSVILQITAYTWFEEFAEWLRLVVDTVLTESEQDKLGVVHRVGLRYIESRGRTEVCGHPARWLYALFKTTGAFPSLPTWWLRHRGSRQGRRRASRSP